MGMRRPAAADLVVWDPVVRIIHWSMVAAVSVAWFVTEGRIHDTAGYVLLALIAFRIVWGFVGPENARFSSFVRRPSSVFQYAVQICAGREPRSIGHNPLGGWMIGALLATGLAVSLSGWLYTTDAFWGIAWVEQLHVLLAYLLLALAAIHVVGVVFTSVRQRENLVAAMLHGRKRALEDGNVEGSS
jgi:cytochrome b